MPEIKYIDTTIPASFIVVGPCQPAVMGEVTTRRYSTDLLGMAPQ